jgi:prepilin-type N-terminal cleavage/methylation domain-containing protein
MRNYRPFRPASRGMSRAYGFPPRTMRAMTRVDRRGTPCRLGDDCGFGLVEVLVALMLLAVGFLGVVGALGAKSGGVAAGETMGLTAVSRGNYVTTATMLAQQRLEELKQLRYQVGPPAVDDFGADPTPGGFADEGFGAIASYPNFTRQVRVQTGVPAANLKTITVTVGFRLPAQGGNGEAIALSTLVAAMP